MSQGQRLNLKWTVGDIDRVIARAKAGKSAVEICAMLEGSTLESTPDEIIDLCREAGLIVPRSKPVRAI